MARGGREFSLSELYCVKCGNKGVPVPRKASKFREKGHLKKMYCFHCKMETNHMEIREMDFDYTVENLKEDIANGVFKGRECEDNE